MLLRAHRHEAPIGQYHIHCEQIVDGQAIFARQWPSPPPRVSPPTPVVDMIPLGVARPKACVA